MSEDYKIWYVIETGSIGVDGVEYVDDYIDEGTDQEGQVELYIDIDLGELRRQAEMVRDVEDGEVFFKRLLAEKQSEPDNYVEDSVVLTFERDDEPPTRELSCWSDFDDIDELVAQII